MPKTEDGYYYYGPLVFVNNPFDNDDKGNYMYPGDPPIDCDYDGIPIDVRGSQCVTNECILHPDYTGNREFYSNYLDLHIPSVKLVKLWFDRNLFETTENQIKKLIIRYLLLQHNRRSLLHSIVIKKFSECLDMEDFIFLVFCRNQEEIDNYLEDKKCLEETI